MFWQNKLQYHLEQFYVKYSWSIWYPKFRPQKDKIHQNKGERIILGFLISWIWGNQTHGQWISSKLLRNCYVTILKHFPKMI